MIKETMKETGTLTGWDSHKRTVSIVISDQTSIGEQFEKALQQVAKHNGAHPSLHISMTEFANHFMDSIETYDDSPNTRVAIIPIRALEDVTEKRMRSLIYALPRKNDKALINYGGYDKKNSRNRGGSEPESEGQPTRSRWPASSSEGSQHRKMLERHIVLAPEEGNVLVHAHDRRERRCESRGSKGAREHSTCSNGRGRRRGGKDRIRHPPWIVLDPLN